MGCDQRKAATKNGTEGKMVHRVTYTPFNELRTNNVHQKTVKAKVLKLWRSENKKTGDVWSLEMHLMDEQGTQMQCKVGRENMAKFEGNLKEGCVYSINRFNLAVPNGGYRIVNFRYIMWLNRFAKVHQLEEDGSTFPSEWFDLLPLDRVIERNKTTTFYTAVMGKLTSVSNIVIKPVEDYDQIRDVPMREIVIENQQGDAMKVTLWDELTHVIEDGVIENTGNIPPVVIVTGTFTKEHLGNISLTTTSASRVFVDLDNQQVQQFRNQLGEETTEVEKISLEPQEDPYENKITLFQATKMLLDEGNIDKTFICEGTVVKVMEGKGWYYFACKTCHQKTGNENGRPTCNNCADDFEGEIPWYRVSLKIKDKTESAVVTIIGRTLERMLKMTVDEHIKLKERCEKLGEPEKTMRVFDRIINKTFLFKLLMTEYNITNHFPPKSSGTPIPKAGEKRRVLTKPTGPKTPLKKNKNNVVISDDEEPADETDKVLEEKMIEDKNGEKQAEKEDEEQDN